MRKPRPDILIALGPRRNSVLAKNRMISLRTSQPSLPMCPQGRSQRQTTSTTFSFVATEYSIARTLELARQLQPKARDVAVIGGASDYDRQWLDDARRELQPYSDRYTIKYIEGLPYDEMLKQVSRLSKDSIAVMSYVFVDGSGSGRRVPSASSCKCRSDFARARLFANQAAILGVGIVGGPYDETQALGTAGCSDGGSRIKLKVSNNLATISTRQTNSPQMYDTNDRSGGGASARPGCRPTAYPISQFDLWEQYRWQIISIAIIVLAQGRRDRRIDYLERRRRQAAELELRDRLLEVIHLNRTAVAGTLSASIAHELNQPLGAIQSYAEAAMLYLGADPPNVARAEQILSNILRDNDRAAQIISHLRALLKKKSEDELEEIDLSEVVHDTLQIVGPEALKKGIGLVANQEPATLSSAATASISSRSF